METASHEPDPRMTADPEDDRDRHQDRPRSSRINQSQMGTTPHNIMKYHTVTVTGAAWGHLTNLQDWSNGKVFDAGTTKDGRHELHPGPDGTIIVGRPDPTHGEKIRPWSSRPWDADGPDEELALEKVWAARGGTGNKDYYIALRNGSPQPDCAVCLYGDFSPHVFAWGEDENGEPLHRFVLLEHLKHLNLPQKPEAWDPVWIFHGLDYRAVPKFDKALHLDHHIYPSWYSVQQNARRREDKLPAGYRLAEFYEHRIVLEFDEQEVES